VNGPQELNSRCHFAFGEKHASWLERIGLGVPAMTYQQLGYAVLPLQRGGKRPHKVLPATGGVHHATVSGQEAMTWWAQDPAANIGVACGSVSRLAVIDLDVKHGHNGISVFGQFLSEHRVMLPPECGYMITPSGGDHIWLRTPPGWRVPERPGILPGVDIKGDGGYVAAPPSMLLSAPLIRPGERADPFPVPYVNAGCCPCSVPQAPQWVLEWLLTAPSAREVSGGGRVSEEDSPDLAQLRSTGVERGQRNSTLYRLACQRYRVLGTGMAGAAQVLTELMSVWEAGDRSGMTSREILVIAESARRFIDKMQEAEARLDMSWAERLGRR
jgi:hypothetical protein